MWTTSDMIAVIVTPLQRRTREKLKAESKWKLKAESKWKLKAQG